MYNVEVQMARTYYEKTSSRRTECGGYGNTGGLFRIFRDAARQLLTHRLNIVNLRVQLGRGLEGAKTTTTGVTGAGRCRANYGMTR